ncbi:hypothetical protein [Pallidibacillus thermolactis]|jgi:Phospholipase D Active site motif|uniref:hypothetical protein n=1 Tax=Pallidibacillus thermolactis TaxID=251051 RepID=UPI00399D1679
MENPSVFCNIITLFYRKDFIERVSSIYGLERLLYAKANIYALVDLHSKLYVFDSYSAIIGSANFTSGYSSICPQSNSPFITNLYL